MVVDKSQVGVATSFNTLMKYLGQTVMMVFYGMTFNVVVASGLKKQPSLTSEMMNKIVSPVQAKSWIRPFWPLCGRSCIHPCGGSTSFL